MSSPLIQPDNPPRSTPLVTVQLNEQWWPYVIGLVEQCTVQGYWGCSAADWEDYLKEWSEDLADYISEQVSS